MSDLTNSQVGQNYRKARGFSNFNSRNVVFYTVYFAPKTMSWLDDYNNNVQNNEFSQLVSTIAFAGVELFFLGAPASNDMGGPAFIIGVNTDTSNMGDSQPAPIVAENLTSALANAGWMNYVVRNIVGYRSISSPFLGL